MVGGRKACLAGDRCQPRSITESAQCTLLHSPRTAPNDIAAHLGVSVGYLRDAVNTNRTNARMPIEWIDPLIDLAGNPAMLEYLARRHGYVLVRVPQVTSDLRSIQLAFMRLVEQTGRDSAVLQDVLRDNRIDLDELARTDAKLELTALAVFTLQAELRAAVARAHSQPEALTA